MRPKSKLRLFGLMKNYLGSDAAEEAKEELFRRLAEAGYVATDEKGGIVYALA